jgi:hypothetical protein
VAKQEFGLSQQETVSPELDISGLDLVEVFQGRKFRMAIQLLSGRLRNTDANFESGFLVMRHLYDPNNYNLLYNTSVDGESVGFTGEGLDKFYKQVRQQKFTLIDLHFHPFSSYGDHFIPSYEDLRHARLQRELFQRELLYDIPTLDVICQIRGNGTTDMLLYQESASFVQNNTLTELCAEELLDSVNKQEVLETLHGYGYKAQTMVYGRDGLALYDQESLKAFGFTLKPV